MTGSEKYTWGVILTIGGSAVLMVGILLSASLIGACLGVPLAIISLPVMVWGIIWAYQGHFQKQQEVISAGIREGISLMQAANANMLPPPVAPAAAATSGAPAGMTPMLPIHQPPISEDPTPPRAVNEDGERRTLDGSLEKPREENKNGNNDYLENLKGVDPIPPDGEAPPS
ncbi:MAG TPA: hypothetical protein VIJ61_10235 [Thermoanaerobaculia bacterium]